jgi:hypothetical protein
VTHEDDDARVFADTGIIAWGGVTLQKTLIGSGARATGVTAPCASSALSDVGAPTARKAHSAVWTGTSMIIFGGITGGFPKTSVNPLGWHNVDDGASYDPATDTWSPLIPGGTPGARAFHKAWWTGSEMIVWGGGVSPPGCIYRP